MNAGLGSETQLAAALRSLNAEQCDPPLPESEVDCLARDAATWEPSRGTGGSPVHAVPPPHGRAGHATVQGTTRVPRLGAGAAGERGPDGLRRFLTGTDVEQLVQATSWLWPGWIADGHVTVLAGESGVGKSWLALALARSVVHGLPWPDGQPNDLEPGPVFWLESEGRLGVLVERAHALNVDLSGFRFMEQPLLTYYLDQQADYEAVVDSVVPSLSRVLIVDAWSKSLAGSENDSDVRFCLDDLQSLARTMQIPVVLVHHLRKKQLGDYAEGFDFDRLRGSSVLSQVATCVIGVDQPTRGMPHCRVSCGKANLAQPPEPFGFAVTGGFQKGVPATLTFGPPPDRTDPASRLDEAKTFLRQALADGPRPANEVKEEAKAAGISEFTLKRARQGLCACIRQRGAHNLWLWELASPPGGENDAPDGHLGLVTG